MTKQKIIIYLFVLMAVIGIVIGWYLWRRNESISIQDGTLVNSVCGQCVNL